MKKVILILVISMAMQVTAKSQQRPHYTQYILNQYVLNPALTGIENYTDLKLSARDQWVGLNGAPQSFYLSVHGPIGKEDYKTTPTSFSIPGENPRGNAYWENYTASEPHHGIGLSLVNDKTGLYNRFSAQVSYAYHLGLSPRTNLSAGFAGGISRLGYDFSKANPADPNDPALSGLGQQFRIRPDISAGLWLYSAEYFLGISAQQLIPQQVSFGNDTAGLNLVPHLFATAGYRFLISEDVNLLPSVMVKYVSPIEPQFDLNLKVQYRDLLWMGGSYRHQNGYAAMVGINAANSFNLGYAYDFTRTALNTASRGTHEIVIGFLLNNRFDDSCPRNIW